MAVTRKAKQAAPEVPVVALAAAPVPAFVRLVNGCSTYVTPEREVFYARDSQGNPKLYEVPNEQLGRLLSYRDDWNKRFFKQVTPEQNEVGASKPSSVGTGTQRTTDDRGSVRTGPAGSVEETVQRVEDDEDEEVDTGAMRLKDKDGNDVGVTV